MKECEKDTFASGLNPYSVHGMTEVEHGSLKYRTVDLNDLGEVETGEAYGQLVKQMVKQMVSYMFNPKVDQFCCDVFWRAVEAPSS